MQAPTKDEYVVDLDGSPVGVSFDDDGNMIEIKETYEKHSPSGPRLYSN